MEVDVDQSLPIADQIDANMERASRLLVATDYFASLTLCLSSLRLARQAADWERLSRICLPLQECRRQIRQRAFDSGVVTRVSSRKDLAGELRGGLILIEAPMIGADARAVRLAAENSGVATAVLAREPQNRAGLWPVVGVSNLVVRIRIEPPASESSADLVAWFEQAGERLGDEAISQVDPQAPAAHRVDDLLERLDAVPDHEKLHQRLADAARDAMTEPEPATIRRRPLVDDPTGF